MFKSQRDNVVYLAKYASKKIKSLDQYFLVKFYYIVPEIVNIDENFNEDQIQRYKTRYFLKKSYSLDLFRELKYELFSLEVLRKYDLETIYYSFPEQIELIVETDSRNSMRIVYKYLEDNYLNKIRINKNEIQKLLANNKVDIPFIWSKVVK